MKRAPVARDHLAIQEWEVRQGRGRQVSQDLPLTRRTLAVAMAAVAMAAALSAIWPMGFAL